MDLQDLERFGRVWEVWRVGEGLGPFKKIWEGLGRFVGGGWRVWKSLGGFGSIWKHLGMPKL